MKPEKEKINNAAAAIREYNKSHIAFLNLLKTTYVSSVNKNLSSVGKINVDNNELSIKCLGVDLYTEKRIVVGKDRYPIAMEYSFMPSNDDEDIPVLTIYLHSDNVLYMDSDGANRLCDADNNHLAEHIIYILAENLLLSKIFTPKNCGEYVCGRMD